jgi:hypothetical protein
MAGVAARYGETGASPYLLPLSVDGLIVVASICLVELGGRITALEAEKAGAAREAGADVRVDVPVTEPGIRGLIPVPGGAAAAGVPAQASRRVTPAALAEAAAALRTAAEADAQRVPPGGESPMFTPTMTRQRATTKAPTGGAGVRAARGDTGHVNNGAASTRTEKRSAPKARRTTAETVALAARIKAERPGVTETELAAALGISASRWRTVRREAGDLRLAA